MSDDTKRLVAVALLFSTLGVLAYAVLMAPDIMPIVLYLLDYFAP